MRSVYLSLRMCICTFAITFVNGNEWLTPTRRSSCSLCTGVRRRSVAAFLHPGSCDTEKYDIIENENAVRRRCLALLAAGSVRRAFVLSLLQAKEVADDDSNSDEDYMLGIDAAKNDNDDELVRRRTKEEWIDGQQMKRILAQKEAEKQRQGQRGNTRRIQSRQYLNNLDLEKVDKSGFVSRISYTDANTLQIEIPSAGVDANALASGAFSALWFSAVIPATFTTLSAGPLPLLFMAPFWLAGGVVAKTAVYDPFVSSRLSIGRYLWTMEKSYLKSKSKKEEGPTKSIVGASVDLAMVVNNVERYQLRLSLGANQSKSFGLGLPPEELEYLCEVINDHCSVLGEGNGDERD